MTVATATSVKSATKGKSALGNVHFSNGTTKECNVMNISPALDGGFTGTVKSGRKNITVRKFKNKRTWTEVLVNSGVASEFAHI